MRSLIDMAADRGAFIDQSQSLNLFVESPNIGQLSSMYFHAWKQGLKTTYYLRSRPATRIAKATVETMDQPTPDAAAVACSLENPETLRGLPVSAVSRPARLLDPGLCLTLRPMAYPTFFEMYRAAIKNTWTVEEVDFSTDVARSAEEDDRRRAPPGAPAGRLLRHRRLDRRQQPGAQPLQAHQRARGAHVPVAPALRRSASRPVLPDAARHLRARSRRSATAPSRPSRTSRRSGRRRTSACAGSTRSSTSTGWRRATSGASSCSI